MYDDVIKAMDGSRTFREHITKLQAILDLSPVDPQLKSGLQAAITSLTQEQFHAAKRRMGNQKVQINNVPISVYSQLYSYCQQHATAGIPQWQVAALSAGWTPPTTP